MRSKGFLEAISSSISWRELFHTSYFDELEFRQFCAYLLVEKYGFPSSAAYGAMIGNQKARFDDWYALIAPGVTA